jgi:hypothetical protein
VFDFETYLQLCTYARMPVVVRVFNIAMSSFIISHWPHCQHSLLQNLSIIAKVDTSLAEHICR